MMSRHIRSMTMFVGSLGIFAAVAVWQAGGGAAKKTTEIIAPLQSSEAKWWKGNLHTHSLWSDGDDFPEMIGDWYRRNHYHFLTLSDHNVLSDGERWIDVKSAKIDRRVALEKYLDRFGSAWVERRTVKDKDKNKEQVRLKPLREFRSILDEPGRFLLIPGEEITHAFAKRPVHINAINLRDVIQPINAPGVTETIQVNMRAVQQQSQKTGWPSLTFLNHPNYRWGVTAEDMLAPELRFFEVFNGHPTVDNFGDATHAGTDRMWDIILALRLGKHQMPVVYGVGTDDSHNYHVLGEKKANPGRGWVMVRTPILTGESIVRAMNAGDFYASSGVTLTDLVADQKEHSFKIVGEKGVTYKTVFYATDAGASIDSKGVEDKDGKPLPVTRTYGPEVGRVVAETDSLEPRYPITGKELYVRAKVVSTKVQANPYAKGMVEMAWTQPVVVNRKADRGQ